MVLGPIAGLLAAGVVAKSKVSAVPAPGISGKSYFPVNDAYKQTRGVNRDKHPDPNKFGRASDIKNNRLWVPTIPVKDLVSMRHKWPVNSETWQRLDKETQLQRQRGNPPWGDGTWLLKSPLFCGNNRRFGPRINSRVDSLTIGSLKDGSLFVVSPSSASLVSGH